MDNEYEKWINEWWTNWFRFWQTPYIFWDKVKRDSRQKKDNKK